MAHAARERGVDGVVCGHIHSAEIRDFGGVIYMNDGDWVESCTALVEHFDGRIEILDWARRTADLNNVAAPPVPLPEPLPDALPNLLPAAPMAEFA